MVAAHISQNGPHEKNKTLSVNETTLLPPLRGSIFCIFQYNHSINHFMIFIIYAGFGPLMAMIFCPQINLKRDSANSRYISVLTGLGAATSKKCKEKVSLFPENDSVFHLDFELTNGDIAKVSNHFKKIVQHSIENVFKNRSIKFVIASVCCYTLLVDEILPKHTAKKIRSKSWKS